MITTTKTRIDRLAGQMLATIRELQSDGTLPYGITTFSQLHDYMDANVGWGDEVDALSTDDRNRLFYAVNDLLHAAGGASKDVVFTATDSDNDTLMVSRLDTGNRLMFSISTTDDPEDDVAVILRRADIDRMIAVLTAAKER